MRKPQNWQGAKKATSFEALRPGGYIIKILNAEEYGSNCLKLSYDICEGEFKDYYKKQYDQYGGKWKGTCYQAVETKKGDVLSSFSNMIYCFENSNRGFVWDWDERKLKGKYVGVTLREEEYIAQNGQYAGTVRTSVKVDTFETVDDIKSGDYRVRECKRLQENSKANNNDLPEFAENAKPSFDIDDSDIQF